MLTTNLYFSIPSSFSPIPQPLSPLATISLFSVSISPSVLFIHIYCSLDSTYKWNHIVFFFLYWHISVSIVPSRTNYAVTNGKIPIFFMAKYYCIVYMSYGFFIYLSTNRHLGGFHISAIVNNTTMNIGVRIFFEISSVWGFFK